MPVSCSTLTLSQRSHIRGLNIHVSAIYTYIQVHIYINIHTCICICTYVYVYVSFSRSASSLWPTLTVTLVYVTPARLARLMTKSHHELYICGNPRHYLKICVTPARLAHDKVTSSTIYMWKPPL